MLYGGNTQMFFPISLVMIGSWLIDRESTHDTLKNIMTIPVSYAGRVRGQALLGWYSYGSVGNLQCWRYPNHWTGGWIIGTDSGSIFSWRYTDRVSGSDDLYGLYAPILIFGQIRGAYLGGSILAFFLGYSMMFFKGGYPCQHLSVFCCTDFSGL